MHGAGSGHGESVVLDGRSLTIADVVDVARRGASVSVDARAFERVAAARAHVAATLADDVEAYGVTTGVGVRKRARVQRDGHERLLVEQHLIGQGRAAPHEVVRATALRLANALARGTTAARPELLTLLVDRINDDRLPAVRLLGSVGQADLAQLADLAAGLLDDVELARGEAIALLNQNAFSTGWGALAVADALALLDALDVAAALDLEAFAAAPAALDPVLVDARPSAGVRTTLERLAELLDGSERPARNLQDPLVFRTVPFLHGAARDAFAFVADQVAAELNTVQSNPVVAEDGRILSIGVFEAAALATSLDLARLALAQVLSSAAERAVKLLQAPLTGLPEGLGARPGLAESALSELGIAVQAFAAEARLLAQPVSLELVSTWQAEGIEDRMTMAPLAARRLAEQVELAARVLSIELLLAAQACDLRGHRLGRGAEAARVAVRSVAPFVGEGDPLPDLEPLVALVVGGALGRP